MLGHLPTVGVNQSASTRLVTEDLRAFARSFPIRTMDYGVRLMFRKHGPGFMRYTLSVEGPLFASTILMFDPDRRQAWLRGVRQEAHEAVGFFTLEFHRMHGGHAMQCLRDQGYEFIGGSATHVIGDVSHGETAEVIR